MCPAALSLDASKPSEPNPHSPTSNYMPNATEKDLFNALHTLRVEKTIEIYGEDFYDEFGTILVLSDAVDGLR